MTIQTIDLNEPKFSIFNYPGRRPKRKQPIVEKEEEFVNDPLHLRWNPDGWTISVNKVEISNGVLKSGGKTERLPYATFDDAHIEFTRINGTFTNCKLQQDSITAVVSLKTKERSGFEVKELSAKMKMHPEAMEFHELDLKTNRSHLHDFFAMRYSSFYDLEDYISKVRMEGNFNNSIISSDDIALLLPN